MESFNNHYKLYCLFRDIESLYINDFYGVHNIRIEEDNRILVTLFRKNTSFKKQDEYVDYKRLQEFCNTDKSDVDEILKQLNK